MTNKSQRIWLNKDKLGQDKHLTVKLEQDVDTLEIMSLKIDAKEVYQDFNADYGVLIGRVNANQEVGVPNVKVSIFIPLDEEDENDGKITSIYPYKTPKTKNNYGKRYNLLPRVGKKNPFTEIVSPKQPFGSFPTREEIVTNPTYLEVYKKYYKFSTVTNESGDYMIFGVPTGVQTVHMSVDVTDIGKYSMSPASMINNLGYSPNLFSDDGKFIKENDDLEALPNIETQEVSVDIIPFWGDTENFEIGITRHDFKVRAAIKNDFVIFGTSFTDSLEGYWGNDRGDGSGDGSVVSELYRARDGVHKIGTHRVGNVQEKIFYYPAELTDSFLNNESNYDSDDAILLESQQYSSYKSGGAFAFIISPNRKKIITNEIGDEVEVPDDYSGGVFTEFRGFMTLEYDRGEVQLKNDKWELSTRVDLTAMRGRLKVPQFANLGEGITVNASDPETKSWRVKDHKFVGGEYYSIAQMLNHIKNDSEVNNQPYDSNKTLAEKDTVNNPEKNPDWVVGSVQTNSDSADEAVNFPSNWVDTDGSNERMFSGNWINFATHFIQWGFVDDGDGDREVNHFRTNTSFQTDPTRNQYLRSEYNDNMPLAGGLTGTEYFMRNDIHQTKFIKTNPTELIQLFADVGNRGGFKLSETDVDIEDSDFLNGSDYLKDKNGSRVNGSGLVNLTSGVDNEYYFFKGVNDSDCIKLLNDLGLL